MYDYVIMVFLKNLICHHPHNFEKSHFYLLMTLTIILIIVQMKAILIQVTLTK